MEASPENNSKLAPIIATIQACLYKSYSGNAGADKRVNYNTRSSKDMTARQACDTAKTLNISESETHLIWIQVCKAWQL